MKETDFVPAKRSIGIRSIDVWFLRDINFNNFVFRSFIILMWATTNEIKYYKYFKQ